MNVDFVRRVKVFVPDVDSKWLALVFRMRSPRIFLFIMDFILHVTNGLVSTLPLLAVAGIRITNMNIMLILGIIFLVVPVAPMVLMICFHTNSFKDDDPTLIKPLSEEERTRRDRIIAEAKCVRKEKHARRRPSLDPTQSTVGIVGLEEPLTAAVDAEAGNQYRNQKRARLESGVGRTREDAELEDLAEYNWEFIFKHDDITVPARDLTFIREFHKTPQEKITVN
jgi:hypothetical protein